LISVTRKRLRLIVRRHGAEQLVHLADIAEMFASAESTFSTAPTAVTISVCVTVS
jgi:hypothetical protein